MIASQSWQYFFCHLKLGHLELAMVLQDDVVGKNKRLDTSWVLIDRMHE
jgi:hypothetical protein